MNFIKKYFLFLIAIFLLTISSIIYNSNLFSFFTALFGITYVFLIGRKEWIGYIFGILNNAMYAYTLFNSNMIINGLYYCIYAMPIMFIGMSYWKNNKITKENEEVLPKSLKILLYTFIVFSIIGILKFNEYKWYYDLIITSFSSVALILMAKNFKEQWLLWTYANLIGTFLWTSIFVEELYDISLFIMWSIYLINSIYFLFETKKQTK